MRSVAVIVLAAGLGTRMKSSVVKVLHPIVGRPMLLHTLGNIAGLKAEKTVVVLGHQADRVKAVLPVDVLTALQKEQLGTAHAASTGLKKLGGFTGTVVVVSGDTPLLGTDTFKRLVASHRKAGADATVLTAVLPDPTGYGRIIRAASGVASVADIERIVEHKDASPSERAVTEINAGTYCFEASALKAALKQVRSDNKQGEYYLTDVIAIIKRRGGKVGAVQAECPQDALGINSRVELAQAEKVLRRAVNRRLMESGVTMPDPESTYIGAGVSVGKDTVVYPGNFITGNSVIGQGCLLYPGNFISDSTVKDGAVIKGWSVLSESCVDEGAQVGPFAHVRPGSRVCRDARVGNFVELKKTLVGEGSKASHLSYLGDAIIGRDVNVGAGTITCNYDGYEKYLTVIEDGVFVGSDTQFVAPVRVGKGAVIAAGSTITSDVPKDSLAISRTPQANRPGWAKKRREEKSKGGK